MGDTEQCFLSLERTPEDVALLDKIFRLAHNLKGSAKAVGFEEMGAFAHTFESFLLKVKNGELPKSSAVISLLLACNDFLNQSVQALKRDLGAKLDAGALLGRLEAGLRGEGLEDPSSAEEGPSAEEAAVLMAGLTEKGLSTPEVPAEVATESEPPLAEVKSIAEAEAFGPSRAAPVTPPPAPAGDSSLRVSLARLETLLNFVGEMVILQTVLREQVYQSNPTLLRRTVHQLGKVTKEVQDIAMGLRLVPIKQNFQKMQRIVRDTATSLEKKVELSLEGEETELDKTVLDAVADPLVHLVRNAVDHGIEDAAKRKAAGKPETGHVLLRAFQQAGKLIIEVRDDGGGINPDVLRAKALEKGILREGQKLSDKEAIHLIFHPGFSTKQVVTDVSGRGVGMDVVKTNIEALQGEVVIDTQLGKGTCFRILLPLTLAIMDGMVVRCGEERFVIPLSQVFECVKPEKSQVQFNTGMGETLILREVSFPLVRLGHSLGRKGLKPAWESIAIVVRSGERPFAILVDDVIGQHQIVVKKLGPELQRLKAFSGSAVLGDGRPALIIEPVEVASMMRRVEEADWNHLGGASA